MATPLRLMIYDATCRGSVLGLTHAWIAGGALYRALGRFDAVLGAASWSEALDAAGRLEPERAIGEIQFWGHGKWGSALVDRTPLSVVSLAPEHEHRPLLDRLARRMTPSSLWWFRTCETFGADAGHRFAREWTAFFGCRAAGHTFVIADWQSGLHSLAPGATPTWSTEEGLAAGTPADPQQALWSRPWSPRTIHCLQGHIPTGW